MTMAGQAHPEELIRFNAATGKFEVGREALATLSAHRGPVGVVAVCGRARQGKSYILNQLLGQSSGFQVAATHRPCTKGLWMWSAPVPRTAPDGSPYHLVRPAAALPISVLRVDHTPLPVCCPQK